MYDRSDNVVRVVDTFVELSCPMKANRLRLLSSRHKYKRRQAILEHAFGPIKRSEGFYYAVLKGKEKINREYSLASIAYNMRRAVSILGVLDLVERLKAAFFNILALERRVERLIPPSALENFRVVWRWRAVHGGVCSIWA